MARIVFDYTLTSKYCAQGSGPSMQEGYDIWLDDEESTMYSWLGFASLEEFEGSVYYYQQRGDRVFSTRKDLDHESVELV